MRPGRTVFVCTAVSSRRTQGGEKDCVMPWRSVFEKTRLRPGDDAAARVMIAARRINVCLKKVGMRYQAKKPVL